MSDDNTKGRKRPLDDWLTDIQENSGLIVSNTDGKTKEEFYTDRVLQDHVVLRLVGIGEAVKYIERFFPEFPKQVTTIPWSDLARTRDKLVHSYFGIDPRLVWAIARNDMPPLRNAVSTVIANRRIAKNQAMLGKGSGMA